MSNAVEFRNLKVAVNGVTILEGINASVPMGSCTMVVGPNGAGKTTLLEALLGQLPYEGEIRIASGPSGRRLRIGYVPQRLGFDRGMPLTVSEFLSGTRQRLPLWFGVARAQQETLQSALREVEAQYLAEKPLGGLSGGELQRVLVALALLNEPELLVLDEPTAGMDVRGEQVFCELIERLRKGRGFTQIMVSHDIATVTYHATHVLCLNRRLIAEGEPRNVLTRKNLMAVFGVHLGLANLEAIAETPPAPVCAEMNVDA